MPPSRASAIASRASVTVSIAAETSGMLERDRAREPRRGRDVVRQHRRLGRDEQHVVEGQPLLARTSPAAALESSDLADRKLLERPSMAGYRRRLTASDRTASRRRAAPSPRRARLRAGGLRAGRSGRRRARASRRRRRRPRRAARPRAAARAARGEERGEQHVARADRRDRLEPRRDGAEAAQLARPRAAARSSPSPCVISTLRAPQLGDRGRARARSPRRRGTPGRRAPRPRAGSARRANGSASTPSRSGSPSRVEHGGDARAREVADRLGVEVVRRRRAAASRRRRRARRPARGSAASRAAISSSSRLARPGPTR